jgi:hypothetical protein
LNPRARVLPARLPLSSAAAVAVVAIWGFVALVIAIAAGGASFSMFSHTQAATDAHVQPSEFARGDIPPEYLKLYIAAAHAYDLDWAVLAAIGKVECDHGRGSDASCSRAGATNSSGAGGPMQFLASTWASYGRDANNDGSASRWDPADAIYSAARYLAASGGRREERQAIFAYNHAGSYVDAVESWATRYRRSTSEGETVPADRPIPAAATSTPVAFTEGERALLTHADGHLALIPSAAPIAVQAMVVAGNELQDLPYGPQGHPNPLGAPAEDCSSSVNYVLYRAGIRPPAEIVRENPLAQDYVHWGAAGPGRWVSVYATAQPIAHAFIVIAGLRLDTSHNGTDFGPNSHEDGPRWRLFDRIPAWAKWSVRHPPGL